jgi:hypothetical protein
MALYEITFDIEKVRGLIQTNSLKGIRTRMEKMGISKYAIAKMFDPTSSSPENYKVIAEVGYEHWSKKNT